jgi:hypothetical protein
MPTVVDAPEPKKSTDPTKELHKRAREVQDLLKRLLKEINELLEKTKHLLKNKDSKGP